MLPKRAFLVILAVPIWAEPPRQPEIFGSIGTTRAGGDEGSAGSGLTYGGAFTLPFAQRWAVDVQALGGRLADSPDYRLNRVLFSPAIQYRRGNERALWFIAFGPGTQHDRTRSTFTVFDGPGGTRPRQVTTNESDNGLTLHGRTGGVFRLTERMLIRGEFFWANRYVLPNVGVAISLGVRLGR